MARYFILGPNASVFWDPTSKLKVVSSDENAPDALHGNMTDRIKLALKANHIQEIKSFKPKKEEETGEAASTEATIETKKETKKAPKQSDLTKMTKDQLVAYYKENYETTDEDIKNFSAMKPKQMVQFLQDEDLVS